MTFPRSTLVSNVLHLLHLLHLLELLHGALLEARRAWLVTRFAELVEDTARFMASFVEVRSGTYHVPAPVMPAQQFYDARATEDPTFELAYWWYGLEIAQSWRERLGLERDERWRHIRDNLAAPHRKDGLCTAVATEPHLRRDDHPSLLCALGLARARSAAATTGAQVSALTGRPGSTTVGAPAAPSSNVRIPPGSVNRLSPAGASPKRWAARWSAQRRIVVTVSGMASPCRAAKARAEPVG